MQLTNGLWGQSICRHSQIASLQPASTRQPCFAATIDAVHKTRKDKVRSRHKSQRRKGQQGTPERPRLAVYRSNNHIYAQVIDDTIGHTLAAVSSVSPTVKGELEAKYGYNKEAAETVGKKLADVCLSKSIEKVFFDRGGLMYHGRVQALAEGAREGGLQF